jgi:histidine ammonia-lyase
MSHHISSEELTLANLKKIVSENKQLDLSNSSKSLIEKCRKYLDDKLENSDQTIYGINTGFGSLCDTVIDKDDREQLQLNLVRSHAAGAGDEVPKHIVKLMLLLKAQGLSYGHSGAQLDTVQRLIDFYNNDILPVVYQMGSLGASGDLAPLAHLSLPLFGEGEVHFEGKKQPASKVLEQKGWEPLRLRSKEGLALLNGTQFMSAYGSWGVLRAQELLKWADLIAALSLEAYDGRIEPFHSAVHKVRKQPGQLKTAERFQKILEGSELITREKEHVQDPYSFRCVPQVHGASKDVIENVARTFENEINSVTDNPTVFPDEDLIISAGNFHGQPVAMAHEQLALAMAEIGSISERRTYKLVSGTRGLPAFLVDDPGLNSGFMIPQYTAASMVSQNKQLCTPAVVDTIDSSNGQEDHVSMGANAATKMFRVIENVENILAIELLNAAQGLEFRRPAKSSKRIESLFADFRAKVPFAKRDVIMHDLMQGSLKFIRGNDPEKYLS